MRLASAAAWVVALAASTTTAQAILPDIGIDSSWQMSLYTAFERHLAFGTDVIWTYGPYGWLDFPFFFDLSLSRVAILVNIAGRLAFLAVVAAYLWSRKATLTAWIVVGLTLGAVVDWSVYVSFDNSITYASIPLLVLALTTDSRRLQLGFAIASGSLLGLASLVRGTDVVISVALLAITTAYGFALRRPRPLLPILAAAATFVLLWLASFEDLGSIPAYLRGTYEIASGYTAAMSRTYDFSLVLPCAIAILVMFATGAILGFASRGYAAGLVLLLCLPTAFVSFKEGFVRHSYLSFFYSVLILLCLAAPEVLSGTGRGVPPASAMKPAWWMVAGLCVGILFTTIPTPFILQPRAPVVRVYGQAVTSAFSESFRARQQSDIVRTIQQHYQLPADLVAALRTGDVDVMPWDTDIIYGYQLNWKPRPVLQSYVAYTPYLDQADATFLSSGRGPRYIVYYFYDYEQSLDARYTAFDEPAAFRALLEHYVPTSVSGPLLLQQRSTPIPDSAVDLGRTCAPLGNWISVPTATSGRYVYASLDIPYSVSGLAMNLLYKPAELRITFRYQDNLISPPFRVIPRIAADGYLVSAYVSTSDELAHLFEGQVDNPITAFRVTTLTASQDYEGGVCSTFVGRAAPSPAT